jgi:hypothetical protein
MPTPPSPQIFAKLGGGEGGVPGRGEDCLASLPPKREATAPKRKPEMDHKGSQAAWSSGISLPVREVPGSIPGAALGSSLAAR